MSHFFACWASQKTHRHARIARVLDMQELHAKYVEFSHVLVFARIARETRAILSEFSLMSVCLYFKI